MSFNWTSGGWRDSVDLTVPGGATRAFRRQMRPTIEPGSPPADLVGMRWPGRGSVALPPGPLVMLHHARTFTLDLTISGSPGAEVIAGDLGLGQIALAGGALSNREAEIESLERSWDDVLYPSDRSDPFRTETSAVGQTEGETFDYNGGLSFNFIPSRRPVYWLAEDVWTSTAVGISGGVARTYGRDEEGDPYGEDIFAEAGGGSFPGFVMRQIPIFAGQYHYRSIGGGLLTGSAHVSESLDRSVYEAGD